MNIRRPHDTLAGTCWLARMVDKVRTSTSGDFPLLYRLSLGNPLGIDGIFLRHFGIAFRDFKETVSQSKDDERVAEWFRNQPRVNTETIAAWNAYGPKLGTPGYPGSWLRHMIKWFVYPKSINHPVDSLFDMIEQDEPL